MLLGLYVLLTGALYLSQEHILFLTTELDADYTYQFSETFEEINLKTADSAVLNALHFKVENPKGVILYFHGNAGDLSRWGNQADFFMDKHYDVLMMDYRTYGKSTGQLSEAIFYSDGQLFYNYLKNSYQENEITIYGRSLGTAIATFLASKNNPKQLILETPYYSIADLAQAKYPIFPVNILLKYKFSTFKFINNISCPITVFHGTDDLVVPLWSAKKLVEQAPKDQTNFIIIPGGNHKNLNAYRAYKHEMFNILE